MQHAAAWDDEFRGGSEADFRDDDRECLRLDESGVPVKHWGGPKTMMAYDDDGTGSNPPGSRLPVLSTLGSEMDDCGASVDTADTRRLHSRGNSKARRRKNTRGSGRPAGRASPNPDGVWSLSRPGLMERRRQQLAAAEKDAVITRMLQTFAAPSDGKSTRMSDFVNMVSLDGVQTNCAPWVITVYWAYCQYRVYWGSASISIP